MCAYLLNPLYPQLLMLLNSLVLNPPTQWATQSQLYLIAQATEYGVEDVAHLIIKRHGIVKALQLLNDLD